MNKKRLIITSVMSIFLVSILLIGSTYSIFTSQEIDESANVYKTGNLTVTYKTSGNVQVDSIPKTEEEADGITPYRITVTNNGNVPYQFDVILDDTTSSTTNTINYDYIMTKVGYLDTKPLSDCTNNIIKEDVILLAGESVEIDIRVWISDTIPNSELGKSFYAKLSIDGLAVYNDSKEINNDNLSLRYMNTPSTSDFRSDTYKNYIKTASFVDYIDTSDASIDATTNEKIAWDMTTDTTHNTNKVIAWLEDNGTTDDSGNKYYDLYIGSNEKIYANSLVGFFMDMNSLENINFNDNLDTSLTTSMVLMFQDCSSLTTLDLSNFDTSNVWVIANAQGSMFRNCSSLTSLDLSSFDTSKITTMRNLFQNCSSLVSLDVSNFDTSNVTSMYQMFVGCSSLTTLDLSSFDTSNVTDEGMQFMFSGCSSLTSLDLSNFNTSKITSMREMFYNCSSLVSLDVSNFDTSSVTNMGLMFLGCSSLTTLDLSSFDTSSVTNMHQMFIRCSSLTNLNISNFDTSNVTSMDQMFRECFKLITEIKIMSNNITNYSRMFSDAATAEGASITIYYVGDNPTTTDVNESTESLVESMKATGVGSTGTSNFIDGGCIGNYCTTTE